MRRPVPVPALVVAVSLAILAACAAACSRSAPAGLSDAERQCGTARSLIPVGRSVPGECRVEPLDGSAAVTLSDVAAGKPMVVNFWASWCSACIQEMPDLQTVYTAAAPQMQFLGLDLLNVDGEIRSAAVDFSRQRRVAYPLAYDNNGLLYGRISLRVLPPTTAFLRADGTLAGFHIGQMTASDLRGLIQQYLGLQVPA